MEPISVFATGTFLSVANQKIIDYITGPVKRKYPDTDFWWLIYVALVSGAALAWFSEVNLFSIYVPDPLVGRVLSCLTVGGGSSLLHDIFKK
jgi:hypothetical protein